MPLVQAADLRLGFIETDTSHVIAFTMLLNKESPAQNIPRARIVAAFKGGSKELADSYATGTPPCDPTISHC
jgi:hypothetical protein